MNFFQIFGFGKSKPMRPEDFTSEEAKAAAAWIETVNPLRGMTSTRMQNLYDASRSGDTVHLQWLYQEIEKIDPTLLICQQRRTGALASLDWHISTRNKKRTRGFDETLAQEQADCLELAFGDADQANFNDAVEHLSRGFFRGFAHVLPRWSEDGLSVKGFDCLDQWNFVRDNQTGVWYWNPEAHAYTSHADCRPIPKGELVTFVAPYHIDYPAMTIYLRSAVGEQGWSKFVERFGIPPVILTMPQDIPSDQVDVWRRSAEKVAEGGSGAVPAGTGVNFCDGARGINPFKDFIHNQRELIVLMSTGGLLTSLTESGSGTLAGGAHSETWAEVRRMDSAKIGSVLNRTVGDTILERAFPGRPKLAYFAFDTEAVPSPGEVFDDAAKARASGYLIDKADLEERTGYRLVKDEPSGGQPGLQGGFNGPSVGLTNKTPFNPSEKPFKIARSDSDGQGDGSASNALLTAFSRDLGPAAEEVKKLLADLDAGKDVTDAAKALIEKLPDLMPKDPAMSAVIAEAMAAEFASHPSQKSQSSQEPLANEGDQPRGETKEGTNSGSFAPAGGGNVSAKNDGKIDFKGRLTSKSKADDQCKKFDYSSVDDMMMQSVNVSTERIDEILNGGDFTCKPHEAVAALRSLRTIQPNVRGEKPVKVGEHSLRHYVCGERRHHGGEPDIGRLTDFPRAVAAIRQCDARTWQIEDRPTVVFPGEKPEKGTETVYAKKFGTEKAKVFAYTDSGVLTGWWVEK